MSAVIGLIALQLQSNALLSTIPIVWPSSFNGVMHYTQFINLDFTRSLGSAGVPTTFQSLFIFFANAVPFIIVLTALLAFQPLRFVILYASFISAVVLTCLGLGMKYGSVGSSSGADWYIAGGSLLLFFSAVVGLTAFFIHHTSRIEEDTSIEGVLETARRTEARSALQFLVFSPARSLKYLVVALSFFFCAILLTGFIVTIPGTSRQTGVLFYLGAACFVPAAACAFCFITSLSLGGRQLLSRILVLLSSNMMKLLLLLLDMTYLPVIDYCVSACLCTTYTCPAGTVFNPWANRPATSYSTSADIFCDPCVFLDDRCNPSTGSIFNNSATAGLTPTASEVISAYCPGFSQVQLWEYPSVSCGDPTLVFFYASSGIVLVLYVIAVPAFYIRVIRDVTSSIQSAAKLSPAYPGEDLTLLIRTQPEVAYQRRLEVVQPAVASLYDAFTLRMCYFNVFLIFFRLAVVANATIVSPFSPEAAIYALVGIHLIGVVSLLRFKPFTGSVVQPLAVSLESCSLMNAVYGVVMMNDSAADSAWWSGYALLGVNIFIPVTVTAIAAYLESTLKQPEDRGRDEGRDNILMVPLHRTSSDVYRSSRLPTTEDDATWRANERLTRVINVQIMQEMRKYFSVGGVLLLCATGLSIFGYVSSTSSDPLFVDGSTPSQRGPMPVLGGYPSFVAMTDACCCLHSTGPPSSFNTSERWICPDPTTSSLSADGLPPAGSQLLVVDRGRVGLQLINNGLPIRPLCGGPSSVTHGCSIVVNVTDQGPAVVLSCPANVTLATWSAVGVTADAVHLLF